MARSLSALMSFPSRQGNLFRNFLKQSNMLHTANSIYITSDEEEQGNNYELKELFKAKCFDGWQYFYSHKSQATSSTMKFGIYLPPAVKDGKVPVLYWLSGLWRDEETCPRLFGAQRYASKYGIGVVCPDTSCRISNIPGDLESEFFGNGASFYLDATQPPWKENYQMFKYVTSELIKVVKDNFPVLPCMQSISGHSMGGHGALICFLKNPGLYCSVSSLEAPCNPTKVDLLRTVFKAYLGDDEEEWKKYDAKELVEQHKNRPIEIFLDQGCDDCYYLEKILLPENLIDAAYRNKYVKCIVKWRPGYDHSEYFVKTFMEEHIKYHARFLRT